MNPSTTPLPQDLHLSLDDRVALSMALDEWASTLTLRAEDLTEGPHRRFLTQEAARCRDLIQLLDSHTITLTPPERTTP